MSAVIYPSIIAFISLCIGVFLYIRWKNFRRRSTLLWCIGFFSYFLSYLLSALFVEGIIPQSYILLHFIRQSLVAVMFVLFYLGVVILFTKNKIWLVYFPAIFFILQEFFLIYQNFFVGSVSIAEKFHIAYFDIPFNIIVALLFVFYFWASKKRYLLFFLIAWFGDAAIMSLSGGIGFSNLFFTISILPILLLFFGVIDFMNKPYSDNVLDITPGVEKAVSKKIEYKIEPSLVYLIRESKARKSFKIFTDIVKTGIYGLCITREKPVDVRKKYGLIKTPVLWLTNVESKGNVVDPDDLEQLYFTLEKFILTAKSVKKIKNVVLLDGIEYLISNNGFDKVLNFVQMLKDRISETNAIMIIPVNPRSIKKEHIEMLEKELKTF